MPLPDAERGTVGALAVDYARLILDHDPVGATSLGLHDRDDELPPRGRSEVDAHLRALRDLAERVRGHDADGAEELDRRGLAALLEKDQVALEWYPQANPYAPVQRAMSAVLGLLIGTGVSDDDRDRCVPARCAAVPAHLEAVRERLDPGEVPPLWAELAAGAADSAATFFREAVPASVPAVGDAAALAADALTGFGEWVGAELRPTAAGDVAVGRDGLTRLLGEVHLLGDSPEDVLTRGEELVERFESELHEVTGTENWKRELDRVKGVHPSADGLLDAHRAEFERLRAFCLEGDVVTDPDADADLAHTPEPLRGVIGYAAYFPPGTFDEEHAGQLWVTPPPDADGLRDHAYGLIPAIMAHEGYPGHHLQVTSVGRLSSVTRRLHVSTLMIEGWGLYVEELMAELGYYDDDARIGQLSMSLWRAARIVLDMSLHLGRIDVDGAVAYLVDRVGMAETTAGSEVARYTMTPTQPFSYLYGAEEIRRIRAAYLARTGDGLRGFHDALLAHGHLPPRLVAAGLSADTSGGPS